MSTPQVLCCYTDLHQATAKALASCDLGADVIDVTDDRTGYWREIRDRWRGETDLIIVEQDIEPALGDLEEMAACSQPWCCYAYPIFRTQVQLRVGLGCTKISAQAQRVVTAREIAEGFELCSACKGGGCWWHLDGRIAERLKHRGFTPHVHGSVTHHHDYGKPPPGGWAIETFIEGDAGPYGAARGIEPGFPREFVVNPRQALHRAGKLARLAASLAADPSQAAPVGSMAPFPLGVIAHGGAYDTDKVMQGYMPTYNRIARELGPSARVCEIGVQHGGSLATWRALFPQATIAGVDIDPGAIWPDRTVRIVLGQDDPALPAALLEHEPAWDLIVDDASHDGRLSARTLELLWPLVSPGGFYVIEDWFVGLPGVYKGPAGPFDSSMADLAKSLLERLRPESDTESVDYRYGMAVMRKRA